MTYVGEGLGDYDAVTTYRFVGRGQGRLAIIPRMRTTRARVKMFDAHSAGLMHDIRLLVG